MTGKDLVPKNDTGPLDQTQEWYASVPKSSRKVTLVGYAIFALGVIGFGAWAGTAPIEGAIVAPGTFVATGQNKVVQHLEGGIVKKLLVKEGDIVSRGQTLLVLDDTTARAELRRLRLRDYELLAQVARLQAERRLEKTIRFEEFLPETDLGEDARTSQTVQTEVFATRRKKLQREIAILEQSISSLHFDIAGSKARLASTKAQIDLIEQELSGKEHLFKKGLLRSPEYFAVKRAKENALGQIGQLESTIKDSKARIVGAKHQIERARDIFVQRAAEELRTTRVELKDIRERIKAARNVLARVEVKAPVRGVVVKMNYHTAGGVIRPGHDIMALLPLGSELLIEARVKPQDIDDLRKKQQEAVVRLTALSQRVTPMVPGKVVYVSADSVPNETRAQDDNAYIVRVRLDPTESAKVDNFVPTPGMPAEVYIKTGDRTFFHYLMQPIYDTMIRAFRES